MPTYASRPERVIAQCLDSVAAIAPILLAAVLEPKSSVLSAVVGVPAVFWIPFYFLCADAFPGGQSLGKRLLKIRVEDIDTGEPCTYGQSILRNFLLGVLGPIDWFFIFGEEHQRLGDRAASTIVVRAA